jgi:hypothetical protein
MASKYLNIYPVPKTFTEILHDFAREILREQPADILEFGAQYFRCMEEGEKFEWDLSKSLATRPADYPRVKGGSE